MSPPQKKTSLNRQPEQDFRTRKSGPGQLDQENWNSRRNGNLHYGGAVTPQRAPTWEPPGPYSSAVWLVPLRPRGRPPGSPPVHTRVSRISYRPAQRPELAGGSRSSHALDCALEPSPPAAYPFEPRGPSPPFSRLRDDGPHRHQGFIHHIGRKVNGRGASVESFPVARTVPCRPVIRFSMSSPS